MSLREEFCEACWNPKGLDNSAEIEKGQNGTVQDFYNRFDEIASGLKAALETLVDDINHGKSRMTSPVESYKIGEPLNFEIVIPACCDEKQQDDLEHNFYYLPGYRKIHEICAGKDVDMNIITGWKGSSYQAQDGEIKAYDSIYIQIDPGHCYCAEKDYKPLPPAQNKSNPAPAA